jgi:hypothetical protein
MELNNKIENFIKTEFFDKFIRAYAQTMSLTNKRPNDVNNQVRKAFVNVGFSISSQDEEKFLEAVNDLSTASIECYNLSIGALIENINSLLIRGKNGLANVDAYRVRLNSFKRRANTLIQENNDTPGYGEHVDLIDALSNFEDEILASCFIKSGPVDFKERTLIFIKEYAWLLVISLLANIILFVAISG